MNRLKEFLGAIAFKCVNGSTANGIISVEYEVKSNEELTLTFKRIVNNKRNTYIHTVTHEYIQSPQIDIEDWADKIYNDVLFRLK